MGEIQGNVLKSIEFKAVKLKKVIINGEDKEKPLIISLDG